MASKLESLSLRPILKVRSPGNLFVVYVGSGQEPDKTVLILKDAGYEAWAVDALP